MKNRTNVLRNLNAIGIIILMCVIIGAYYQEFTKYEKPCPLCYLQRLGMIGVATGALLNLRFGIKIKHYALSLLSAFVGGAVAIRQILLHICPGFPDFGYPVFGLNLYTWSFIVFCCISVGIIFLMFFFKPEQSKIRPMSGIDRIAFFLLVLVTLANCITVFQQCGVSPCKDVPWPPTGEEGSIASPHFDLRTRL